MNEQELAQLYPIVLGVGHRHRFYPVRPTPFLVQDEPQKRLAISGFQSPESTMFLSFWGRSNFVESIAISQRAAPPTVADESRYEKMLNHAITSLRLMQNASSNILRKDGGYWMAVVEDDNPLPSFNPILSAIIDEGILPGISAEQINSFSSLTIDTPLRPLLALLAEARNELLPSHYRVLSLLRAIESLYPGDHAGRRDWVNTYQEQWLALNIGTGSFYGALETIRSKCAHGWPRGGGTPYVGAAVSEAPKVDELLKLLSDMLTSRMNAMAPEGVSFSSSDRT